jgi:hypothetical protein
MIQARCRLLGKLSAGLMTRQKTTWYWSACPRFQTLLARASSPALRLTLLIERRRLLIDRRNSSRVTHTYARPLMHQKSRRRCSRGYSPRYFKAI